MKKLALFAVAALFCVAVVAPAFAVEHQFGGLWQARFYTQQNFSGEEDDARDVSLVDTRTRIYYTAKINDNLKLVNKFEMDTVWGNHATNNKYGDIGADGISVEVKNTYADFSFGDTNFKVGTQHFALARGFLFDDDFSGAIITYKGDGFTLPFIWIKAYEGGVGDSQNDDDVDYYAIAPCFNLMDDALTLKPYLLYNYTSYEDTDSSFLEGLGSIEAATGFNLDQQEIEAWYLGFDLDYAADELSLWFTAIYEGGNVTFAEDSEEIDIEAWLVALGGAYDFGDFGIHGQGFYASGQDDDEDLVAFTAPVGQSYYWAEIMGLGMFDNRGWSNNNSVNAPGDEITNIWALNLGATFQPMDKLTAKFDIWYAQLAEDELAPGQEDELGTEVDLKLTYKLMDNLNLDLVGAYLFAGDATSAAGENEEDPYELGARLTIKF